MTNAITIYGDSEEIVSFSKRIKDMVPGGKNLQDSEARALAQVAMVTSRPKKPAGKMRTGRLLSRYARAKKRDTRVM